MLVFHGNRFQFYPFLPKNVDLMVEFGVFRGDNAVELMTHCLPKRMMLVDAWSAMSREDFRHLSDEDFEKIRAYSQNYYQGDICEQSTHDRIYASCMSKMSRISSIPIDIYKMKVRDFYKDALATTDRELFDIAYIDASHQYEDVFWELVNIRPLLKPNALIVLNDVYWGDHAFKQNMGVLQAVNAAIQVTKFKPLLITDSLFSDLVLTNCDLTENSLGLQFLKNLESSPNHIIETTDESLFSYNHNTPSFWTNRILPSFKIHS